MILLSAQFVASGFYDWCAARIAAFSGSPRELLGLVFVVGGVLSAVFAKDIVVFALTPMLCRGLLARQLDPRPFLLGLAVTAIGNPQNILISEFGGLDCTDFLAHCAIPAGVAMLCGWGVVAGGWRRELREPGVQIPIGTAKELPALDR